MLVYVLAAATMGGCTHPRPAPVRYASEVEGFAGCAAGAPGGHLAQWILKDYFVKGGHTNGRARMHDTQGGAV